MAWTLSTSSEFVGNKSIVINGKLMVGREPTCPIYINKNEISRNHAAVYIEGESAMVVDLDSSNGTFLNGKKLTPNLPTNLRDGDNLMFEQVSFTISSGSAQTSVMRALDNSKTSIQTALSFNTKLTLIKGESSNGLKILSLDGLNSLVIGRSDACQFILKDPTVSGQHARFTKVGSEWELSNLSQTNGLFVNGGNISSIRLNDKDNIELGGCILKFSTGGDSDSTFQEGSNRIPDWLRNQE